MLEDAEDIRRDVVQTSSVDSEWMLNAWYSVIINIIAQKQHILQYSFSHVLFD